MLPPQQTPLQNSPACSLGHYYHHQASLSHPKTVQLVPWDIIITIRHPSVTPKTVQIVPWDIINIITIRHPSVTPKQCSLFPGTLLLPSGIPQSPQNSAACSLGHYYYHQASLSHPQKQCSLFPGTLLILLPSGIPVTPKQCIHGT